MSRVVDEDVGCCTIPPGICLILGLALDEADQHPPGSALGDTARNVV